MLFDLTQLEEEVFLFDVLRSVRKMPASDEKQRCKMQLKQFFKTYCSDISSDACFKDIPCFPHKYFGVFISQGAIIGTGSTIFQQVTIGSNLLVDSKTCGYPTIGNNCYIGAGAKIIGSIVIGDNVRIGANAVIYKNVPENSVVTGSRMNIVEKSGPMDNRYFAYDDNKGWAYKCNGIWNRDVERIVLEKLKDLRR